MGRSRVNILHVLLGKDLNSVRRFLTTEERHTDYRRYLLKNPGICAANTMSDYSLLLSIPAVRDRSGYFYNSERT
jgi:hypothetical protein